MSSAIRDRLEVARRRRFVGRKIELDLFQSALAIDSLPFHVLYIFGPGGIGKTTLLREFAFVAKQAKADVIEIDGRQSSLNRQPGPRAHHPIGRYLRKSNAARRLAAGNIFTPIT